MTAPQAGLVTVREEQVLYFRPRRGVPAAPGAPDTAAPARAILGAQVQQLPPAMPALGLRTGGRPHGPGRSP